MFRSTLSRLSLILTVSALAFVSGCKKQTEAEKQEADRQKLRDEKRVNAIRQYKELANKFPEHEKAQQAAAKAKALEAQGKK